MAPTRGTLTGHSRAVLRLAPPAAALVVAVIASATLASIDGCSSTSAPSATATGDAGADATSDAPAPGGRGSDHSSSIAVSDDDATLFVVNPDADSVSFLDAHARTLKKEVLLAKAAPALDPTTHRFDVAVGPRALALAPGGATLYVTGQRSGHVYAIDVASRSVTLDQPVCSEPVGVLPARDGSAVYVACSTDDAVVSLDAKTLTRTASVALDRRPWGLAWGSDDATLVVTHLLGPGLSVLGTAPLALSSRIALADGPPGSSDKAPHGVCRGMFDALARPGSSELWVPHMMLVTDVGQPSLDFLRTAFSATSIFGAGGKQLARLTVSTAPGDGNAIVDVVSGPRALAFSPDGALAFVADTGSEDVLVVDAAKRTELALVRPLPGHQPEGIAVSHDGHAYVDERNTNDVAVLTFAASDTGTTIAVDGAPIPRVAADPMPAAMRLGQHVFHSANSDELPLTTDHWISCATCHVEGRSDAVVWRFAAGPRDTPSNAGGVLHTGFLLHTASLRVVQDYWHVIDTEMGGHFSDPSLASTPGVMKNALDGLEQYVNYAIPYAVNPSTLDAKKVTAGKAVFDAVGCANCHQGPYFTDSGTGNPTLNLADTTNVVLHDVGTCVTSGDWADTSQPDELGDPRDACLFDTPTLRGVFESAPYFHDGSAPTLEDVFTRGNHHDITVSLSATDLAALIEYVRSL